ncbi:cyclic nucleotide-gated ion channel 1 [Dorcoceras hygrometricum]|uniref:Cyclic nucleotide-gated ion channel 1 n=1 Tax=Dorcoceras hygrometricum TaxID=472368 RepID=A0A2Z7DEA3_9LAMI|nr:cyclic nucleotide-gated ion channel 1 [Dorcoceras hygrometricum]
MGLRNIPHSELQGPFSGRDILVISVLIRFIIRLENQEMAPSVPRTRAVAALRMKQIALDNQSRTIRRLRAKLATERRESAATKE